MQSVIINGIEYTPVKQEVNKSKLVSDYEKYLIKNHFKKRNEHT